jgi:ankyrin repeat protein
MNKSAQAKTFKTLRKRLEAKHKDSFLSILKSEQGKNELRTLCNNDREALWSQTICLLSLDSLMFENLVEAVPEQLMIPIKPNNPDSLPVCMLLSHLQHYSTSSSNDRGSPRGELIRRMVHLAPESARQLFEDGSYLLHRALDANVGIQSIMRIYNLFPEALRHQDDDGNLPLHIALGSSVSETVLDQGPSLQFLLAKYPMSVKIPNAAGQYPLHLVFQGRHATIDRITLVHQKFPDAVKKKDEEGNLPIHEALQSISWRQVSWATNNFCVQILDQYPSSTRCANGKGFLPIHAAAGNREVDTDVVTKIYNMYQEGIKKTTTFKSTPLHIACMDCIYEGVRSGVRSNGISKVCLFLLWSPESALEYDKQGRLPFQKLRGMKTSESFLSSLFGFRTIAEKVRAAVDSVSRNNLVHLLAQSAIMIRGQVDMHDILRTSLLLKRLLEFSPQLAEGRNYKDELPLHLLLKSNARQGLTLTADIRCLLGANPESASLTDPETRMYPFMLAARLGIVESTFELLQVFLGFRDLGAFT